MVNLRSVCATYLGVGVRRLALAWAVRDEAQLEATHLAVGVPLSVVRLEVDAAVVRRRLESDPTLERREDDLTTALEWLSTGTGAGLEDILLPGTLPVREISRTICSRLGWL